VDLVHINRSRSQSKHMNLECISNMHVESHDRQDDMEDSRAECDGYCDVDENHSTITPPKRGATTTPQI
jgi:hypothetical protein